MIEYLLYITIYVVGFLSVPVAFRFWDPNLTDDDYPVITCFGVIWPFFWVIAMFLITGLALVKIIKLVVEVPK